mmetsp:Transcript_48005/g.111203  ORF Transcript_48005/g.111203 Transcript_48005/m.111203 type:complete len:227 (+) Transcript_48005:235-915(+)
MAPCCSRSTRSLSTCSSQPRVAKRGRRSTMAASNSHSGSLRQPPTTRALWLCSSVKARSRLGWKSTSPTLFWMSMSAPWHTGQGYVQGTASLKWTASRCLPRLRRSSHDGLGPLRRRCRCCGSASSATLETCRSQTRPLSWPKRRRSSHLRAKTTRPSTAAPLQCSPSKPSTSTQRSLRARGLPSSCLTGADGCGSSPFSTTIRFPSSRVSGTWLPERRTHCCRLL